LQVLSWRKGAVNKKLFLGFTFSRGRDKVKNQGAFTQTRR
jgi:hypothetical protein